MVSFYTLRTVKWRQGAVYLIDQTQLPRRLRYVKCEDYKQLAEAVKDMLVRGAPAIGVAAAMGLALTAYHSKATTKSRLLKELSVARRVLQETRPTGMNLFWALSRVMEKARSVRGDVNAVVEAVVEEARRMADEDVEANHKIGRFGAGLLQDGDVVLTHCN
jgi:methylthioribose-1-phosphate isomerase